MELFERIKESIKRSHVFYSKRGLLLSRNNGQIICSKINYEDGRFFLDRRICIESDDGMYVDIEELTNNQCEEIHNAMIERYVELQTKSKNRNLKKYLE